MRAIPAFAQWLKQRRLELDLTQEDLAERLNCSVVSVSKIETGQRRPSKQIAGLMAEVLHVPPHQRDHFHLFARGLADAFATEPDTKALPVAQAPAPITALIGRGAELQRIADLLANPECRLLTITGLGGVGKTHLALQAAHDSRNHFPDGVLLVSLAGVMHSNDVPSAIVAALGLMLSGSREIVPQLTAHLAGRRCLLLLDNLEQLLDDGAVARLLGDLLGAAPHLKILATSREPLHAPGEWDLRLQGLQVAATEGADGDLDGAAALFVAAAQRADAQYVPAATDRADIERICRLVDGVPLALELAAAWMGVLAPRDIADEIARSLDVLSGPAPGHDAPQRSVRAVFDQTWRALGADERRVLAALSVFRGGFDRPAAAAIVDVPLPQLAALLGKSLIRRQSEGRFDLHELVRQFAVEKLAEDVTVQRGVETAHTWYFLGQLTRAEPRLRSAEQDATLRELMQDVDNLRAAWDRAVALGWHTAINAAMRGLARLYTIKSWNDEGVQRFGAAAAARGGGDDIHLLSYQAWFQVCMDDIAGGLQTLEGVLSRIDARADVVVQIEPRLFHALALYKAGRYDAAAETMSMVLMLARAMGSRWFEGVALHALSYGAFLHTRELDVSFRGVMRAAEMLRADGDVFQAISVMQNACHIAIAAGEFAAAEQLLAECDAVVARLDNAYEIGSLEQMKGQVALARGDAASARRHFEQSLIRFQEARASKQAADVRALLGRL